MSTQNVNVARFARNAEWDFLCDFQTLFVLFLRQNWMHDYCIDCVTRCHLAKMTGGKKIGERWLSYMLLISPSSCVPFKSPLWRNFCVCLYSMENRNNSIGFTSMTLLILVAQRKQKPRQKSASRHSMNSFQNYRQQSKQKA